MIDPYLTSAQTGIRFPRNAAPDPAYILIDEASDVKQEMYELPKDFTFNANISFAGTYGLEKEPSYLRGPAAINPEVL